ncbi:hypothetical protein D3C76_1465450 [compost metagenome]
MSIRGLGRASRRIRAGSESKQADEISRLSEFKLNGHSPVPTTNGQITYNRRRLFLFFETVKQVRLAHEVQRTVFIHGHAFGAGDGLFQAIQATEQGHETDLLALLVQLQQQV